MPMIAMTTSNSTSVNALAWRDRCVEISEAEVIKQLAGVADRCKSFATTVLGEITAIDLII